MDTAAYTVKWLAKQPFFLFVMFVIYIYVTYIIYGVLTGKLKS